MNLLRSCWIISRWFLQEKYEHQVRLEELRNQMIDLLSNKLQLTNDLISSKKLAEIKKEYDKVRERQVLIIMIDQKNSPLIEAWNLVVMLFRNTDFLI